MGQLHGSLHVASLCVRSCSAHCKEDTPEEARLYMDGALKIPSIQ